MAGLIVLTLWISMNSNAVQPATFDHVRSAEPTLRNLIADGYARSATFRELVDTVEQLPCVVYIVTTVKLSQRMTGALLHWSVGLAEKPMLRVLVKSNLSRDEAIATIAHELQHVVEAVRGSGAGRVAITAAFDKLDPTARARGANRYETEAAVGVAKTVRDELWRASRRPDL
jgi:hypothetical protein